MAAQVVRGCLRRSDGVGDDRMQGRPTGQPDVRYLGAQGTGGDAGLAGVGGQSEGEDSVATRLTFAALVPKKLVPQKKRIFVFKRKLLLLDLVLLVLLGAVV